MKLVRVARVLLGISAKELSQAAALSARELHRIEAGVVQAPPATLARLDAAFAQLLCERECEARHVA